MGGKRDGPEKGNNLPDQRKWKLAPVKVFRNRGLELLCLFYFEDLITT